MAVASLQSQKVTPEKKVKPQPEKAKLQPEKAKLQQEKVNQSIFVC